MNINKALDLVLENFHSGKLRQSEHICRKILKKQPNNVDALHFLGVIYQELGHYDFAIKNFQKALQIDPTFADAYNNLGNTFQKTKQLDEAIACYRKTLQINPRSAQTYYNLGICLQDKGQLDEAIASYQEALQLNFNTFGLFNNLGLALHEKGKTNEAIEWYQKALKLNPNFSEAYYNLGNSIRDKGLFDEAINCYQKALQIDPNYADAHWNMALALLLSGDFKQGWEEYEWRWKLKKHYQYNLSEPLWDGSDITGLTILLHAEQGFGDTIQFIRYASLIAQRGAKVVFECLKELASLLQNVEGVYQLIPRGDKLPSFDIQCPLLSLPLVFNTTPENIPSKIPYVHADSMLVQRWKDKVQYDNSKLKIGLVWYGNPKHKNDRNRSCPFANFSPFSKFTDITFYSLQKGKGSEQSNHPPDGMNFFDLTGDINDFSDTASFIENLDLIISVDTAVAHLAGALGKPVWTLLPFAPDWRWMLNREDSPWYPTMKLFRQPSPGSWDAVIARITDELQKLVS